MIESDVVSPNGKLEPSWCRPLSFLCLTVLPYLLQFSSSVFLQGLSASALEEMVGRLD